MIVYCQLFYGIPCCERLASEKVAQLISGSHKLALAQNVIHADRLVVVGHINQKQAPLVKYLWTRMAYPAKLIHISGCQKPIRSYAFFSDEEAVLEPDTILDGCDFDLSVFERAIGGRS